MTLKEQFERIWNSEEGVRFPSNLTRWDYFLNTLIPHKGTMLHPVSTLKKKIDKMIKEDDD